MLAVIMRTSDPFSEEKPCEGVQKLDVELWQYHAWTVDDPNRLFNVSSNEHIYFKGWDHDTIPRQSDQGDDRWIRCKLNVKGVSEMWFTHFESLAELALFTRQHGEVVVENRFFVIGTDEPVLSIEIYDGYRE